MGHVTRGSGDQGDQWPGSDGTRISPCPRQPTLCPAAQQMLSAPLSSANHGPAAAALSQSQTADNIEAVTLDQSEAKQQTDLCEATSCAGLWPPGSRDPDVSLDGTLPANQKAGLRPSDQ